MDLIRCGMKSRCYELCPASYLFEKIEEDATNAAEQVDAVAAMNLPAGVENDLVDRVLGPLEKAGSLALASALIKDEGGPWRAHYVDMETGEPVEVEPTDMYVCCQVSVSRLVNVNHRQAPAADRAIAVRGGVFVPRQAPAA